jgi:hypothetical protein
VGLQLVDELLASARLAPAAKAQLLLRTCQFAHRLRPALVEVYWPRLRAVRQQLPASQMEAYKELAALLEAKPGGERKRPGFLAEIARQVETARARGSEDPQAAAETLDLAVARLRSLWWWPFGKLDLWHGVASAWTGIKRERSLGLLSQCPGRIRHEILLDLNSRQSITEGEWDTAFQAARKATLRAAKELLTRETSGLQFSDAVARAASEDLLAEAHAPVFSEETKRKTERDRAVALDQYQKLVASVGGRLPGTAEWLMERWFSATAKTTIYNESWLDRFGFLARLIVFWAQLPLPREQPAAFLKSAEPQHLRDFAVTRWIAMFPKDQAEAGQAWAAECASFRDAESAEAAYLVCLVHRGLNDTAVAMAGASKRKNDLVPRIRKAILCESPAWAASHFTEAELGDDVVGAFLLAPSLEARVEFLRDHTDRGRQPLPAPLWSKPRSFSVSKTKVSQAAEPAWYLKSEGLAAQFSEYVRLHAYGQYSYDSVDPQLLRALVAWDEQHPEETRDLVKGLWNRVSLTDLELQFPLFRGAVFERCQEVLPAIPRSFVEVFVRWLKTNLVDKSHQHQVGNTIYTISFKSTTPFLYCLLGAQKLAPVSAQRSSELLDIGLREFTADDDMAGWAAELYAARRTPSQFEWELPKINQAFTRAWQIGLVDALRVPIVTSMAEQALPAAVS